MSDAPNGGSSEQEQGQILIHVFGRTDVGQIREHNEDNFLVADLTRKSRSLMESDRRQSVGRSRGRPAPRLEIRARALQSAVTGVGHGATRRARPDT